MNSDYDMAFDINTFRLWNSLLIDPYNYFITMPDGYKRGSTERIIL